jgi:hypothetical protein
VIAKINKGQRVNGLIYYLFGPGRHEEHESPRLIGSWDGLHEYYAELSAAELSELLNQPLSLGRPDRRNVVWHTSLRNHAEDRHLSDDEWLAVARDVLAETGIAVPGDVSGARWLLVRHADDHVHLVATLAANDSGRAIRVSHDYRRVRDACQRAEATYQLQATGVEVGQPSTSRAELEQHPDGVTPRDRLRSLVRAARVDSGTPAEFLDGLRARGMMVRERYSQNDPEQVTGYAVAWPRDTTGTDGGPVWFGGGKLAPDLSWPKIVQALDTRYHTDLADAATTEAATTIEEVERLLADVATRIASPDGSPLVEGQRVRALDRGNVGTVAGVDGGRVQVRFVSAEGGEATIWLDAGQVEPLRVDGIDQSGFIAGVDEISRAVADAAEGVLRGPITAAADRFSQAALDRTRVVDHALGRIATLILLMNPARTDVTRILIGLIKLMEVSEELRRVQQRRAQADYAREAVTTLQGVTATRRSEPPTQNQPGQPPGLKPTTRRRPTPNQSARRQPRPRQ